MRQGARYCESWRKGGASDLPGSIPLISPQKCNLPEVVESRGQIVAGADPLCGGKWINRFNPVVADRRLDCNEADSCSVNKSIGGRARSGRRIADQPHRAGQSHSCTVRIGRKRLVNGGDDGRDRLEEQLEHGSDPEAVIEYQTGSDNIISRLRSNLSKANLCRLRTASGVSRQSLTAVRDGHLPTKRLAVKIMRGLHKIDVADQRRNSEAERLLELARRLQERLGLRPLAMRLGVDHSSLNQVLSGKRAVSKKLQRMLERISTRLR